MSRSGLRGFANSVYERSATRALRKHPGMEPESSGANQKLFRLAEVWNSPDSRRRKPP
jgi:hypothetical protein